METQGNLRREDGNQDPPWKTLSSSTLEQYGPCPYQLFHNNIILAITQRGF